jgi:hypothetical protein
VLGIESIGILLLLFNGIIAKKVVDGFKLCVKFEQCPRALFVCKHDMKPWFRWHTWGVTSSECWRPAQDMKSWYYVGSCEPAFSLHASFPNVW